MSDNTYNKRTWLNAESSDSTGSIVAFNGKVNSYDKGELDWTFLEISDCQTKIRLHRTIDDSKEDFISKMELLKNEIQLFINHLKN